jgi:hypothetical protein
VTVPSPTALTLATLRKAGYTAAVVERFIAQVNVRVDLWHFADVIACHPGERCILLVQCTSLPHVGDRLRKAQSRPEVATWLRSGGAFQVWGWRKVGDRWHVRIVQVKAEDLAAVEVQALPRRRRPRKGERQRSLFD